MKKIDLCRKLLKKNEKLFSCPVCRKNMRVYHENILICKNKHTFDLSKKGYINLLLNSTNTHYSKKMFESRNLIYSLGVFDKMTSKVSDLIHAYHLSDFKENKVNILDVGCGEGSHLANIIRNLNEDFTINFQGVGIDIEKEAIKMASREYLDIIWCVADLAKSPFRSEKFDIVTNIFTPSNYAQFNRVLKKDGILIKVIPGSKYLEELRNIFYKETDKQSYNNEKVIKHFESNFNIIYQDNITYNVKVSGDELRELIQLTPLSWGVEEKKIQEIINNQITNVTIDLCIIIGKQMNNEATANV